MVKVFTGAKTGLLVVGLALLCFAELKVGYVDSDKILAEYQGTKEAQEKLKKEYAKWEQEATERQKKMKDLKDQLEKQSLLLSAERKKEIESEYERLGIELNKFLQEKYGDAQKKQEEVLRPIIEKVNLIIEKIAKNENYDFIFDSRGMLYGKKAYDITEKVMQALVTEQK